MSTVRLNYDGWLALPAAVRQKFGLVTGDQLDLELSDDAIILRPRRTGGVVEQQAPELPVASAEPTTSTPPPAAAAAPIVKRGPGRPRKSALPTIPPTLKARGGRRKVTPAAVP
jgi:AbrB family looped-hinge helix DNA binding protein